MIGFKLRTSGVLRPASMHFCTCKCVLHSTSERAFAWVLLGFFFLFINEIKYDGI